MPYMPINKKYEINENGEIRNIHTHKIKTPTLNKSGYLQISINNKTSTFHRVLYTAFYGPIPDGYCINHIDRNRLNNNLNNLEAITYKQNSQHALANGSFDNIAHKYDIKVVIDILEKVKNGTPIRQVAAQHNIPESTIRYFPKSRYYNKHIGVI